MQNIEELVKLEMKNSPFNKVEPSKPSAPGSNPWVKYGIVMAAVVLAVVGAVLIYKHDQKKKNERN